MTDIRINIETIRPVSESHLDDGPLDFSSPSTQQLSSRIANTRRRRRFRTTSVRARAVVVQRLALVACRPVAAARRKRHVRLPRT